MNQPSEEQKQAALEAGREGMKKAYERSRGMSHLSWWERLLWIILAGAAAAASCLLSGCGHSVKLGPEGAVICKDGGLTFTQTVYDKDITPVVQAKNK